MDVVFVPDSELVLPGRGGVADPLANVRHAAIETLANVVNADDVEAVVGFYTSHTAFDTPLPGRITGEGLLAEAGYTGSSTFFGCPWPSEMAVNKMPPPIADLPPRDDHKRTVVMVMGTGSAAREETSPIPRDPHAKSFDDELTTALESGDVPGLTSLARTVSARNMGATILPAVYSGVLRKTRSISSSRWRAFDQLGVRYFVGSWFRGEPK